MAAKAFFAAVLIYLLLRSVLYALQWRGDPSPAARARAAAAFGEGTGEAIEKGLAYARRGLAARAAWTWVQTGLLLFLILSPFAARFFDRLSVLASGRLVPHAALVGLAFALLLFLVRLPFDFYFDYVLEHRFGFSTETAASWWVRTGKDLLVLLPLSALGAVLFFGLVRLFPRGFVLAVPAGFGAAQALLAFLFPLLLVPLYYRASPLPPGAFRDLVLELSRKAGLRVGEVYVLDESRYSRHTNAFFAGLGPMKNVYLFDTLLSRHPQDETLTVVAHELGHWRGGHVPKGILLWAAGLFAGSLVLALAWPLWTGPGGLGLRPLFDPAGLPALFLLGVLGTFFASPAAAAVSRSFEREADRASVELSGDPAAAAQAERRLARENRSDLLPHPLVVFWFATHPPAVERIEATLKR